MSIYNLQSNEWDSLVLKETLPVVVEFWHQNCVTCLKIESYVKELPQKLGSKVKFMKMNVLDNKENRRLAIQNGVMGTPTFKIYCRGVEIGEIIGLEATTELYEKILQILSKCSNIG
ncbi:thioredoxin family protein [Candidatus Bathyarchaeota archaeon]|nr:thioredoxin family protein [Candidatus Bathyarchaeota archaeon]